MSRSPEPADRPPDDGARDDRLRGWLAVFPSLVLGVVFALVALPAAERFAFGGGELQYGSAVPGEVMERLRSVEGPRESATTQGFLLYVGSPNCLAIRMVRDRVETWSERFPRDEYRWVVLATGFNPSQPLDAGWIPARSEIWRDPSGEVSWDLGVVRFPMAFVISDQGRVEAVLDPLDVDHSVRVTGTG